MMPTEAESLMSSALRRDFLPATGLCGHATLAAQAQHARNGASNAENQENAADELHCPAFRAVRDRRTGGGANKNRTCDLILIRDAL